MLLGVIPASLRVWTLTGLGPEPGECPRLQDTLGQVATAPDPAAAARDRGIVLVDGRVRVIVELIPSAALPLSVPLAIEGQYQHLVQALVAPEELCRLAANPAVALVRLPYPQAPDRGPSHADETR